MPDVIVVGAGGGGPVVAKELAARGLDVLVLEAGAHFDDPEQQWRHLENDANNVLSGYFRFGPSDRSKPAWFRETPQNSLIWQLAGVGGTTLHYYGNSPRAVPGSFLGYDGADAAAYDTAHLFPFTYESLVPYYEWVEHTLPGADGRHGHQGGGVLPRLRGDGAGAQHVQAHHPRLLPPAGERHPPARRSRRHPHRARRRSAAAARVAGRPGLHVLRLLLPGLLPTAPGAAST